MCSEPKEGNHSGIQASIRKMMPQFFALVCAWIVFMPPAFADQVESHFTYVTEVSLQDFKLAVDNRSEGICTFSGSGEALSYIDNLKVKIYPEAKFSGKNLIWGVKVDGKWSVFLNAEHQIHFVDKGIATISYDNFSSLMEILNAEFESKTCN